MGSVFLSICLRAVAALTSVASYLVARMATARITMAFSLQGLFYSGVVLEEQHVLREVATQICFPYL